MRVILIILILILLVCQKDVVEPMPDNTKIAICSDDSGDKKGEVYTYIYENELSEPIHGVLTSINEHDYSKYKEAPHCRTNIFPNRPYFPTNQIIDHQENEDWEQLLDLMEITHAKVTDNYSILYPESYIDNFIDAHEQDRLDDDRFR